MAKKTKLGFDLDGIFIGPPLFVPKSIIEYIYKKSNKNLSYRIPGELESKIRVASHYHLLRPAIKKNIMSLVKISELPEISIFLVSSRFSFLKARTETWIKIQSMGKFFTKMYFNYENEQPHQFKDRIIKKEKIDKFVDDDLDLLMYLSKKNPDVQFYWVGWNKPPPILPENITRVKNLEELKERYL